MFDAKGVDWKDIPEGEPLFRASADGRGFAVSGGVAQAVVHAVKRIDPEREVKVVNAEGLQNCKKMLQMAKAGKYNGYLLEGMACPGGCVAGAGTLQVVKKAAAALEKMKGEASFTESSRLKISVKTGESWKSLMWNNIQILQLQRAEFSALCIEKKQA